MSEIQTQSVTPAPQVVFTTGGTVQAGNGIYLARRADDELLALCRQAVFAYILTARQLGKSSLMMRTVERLHSEGIRTVIIDLTAIGVNVSADEWYLGLLATMEEQLMFETDIVEWWRARQHLGQTQRLTMFFEEVLLSEVKEPVVVFVDEIDTTLSLKFTDDFFAAIRYFYNARAQNHDLARLSFVLIGVATPGDLIKDEQRTPFNIGHRVELTDFTFAEALPLADGFRLSAPEAEQLLRWVLKWTSGHPYLTQRLCRALAEENRSSWTEAAVDEVVARTFFGERSEQDNNLQFVRDMLTKRAPDRDGVLTVYSEVIEGRVPVPDEEQSLIKSHLKLSGVVRRENSELKLRNAIYGHVFDRKWVSEHQPVNWMRRLVRIGSAILGILMLLSIPLAIYAFYQASQANQARTKAEEALKQVRLEREYALEQERKAKEAQDRERAQKEALASDQAELQALINQLQQQSGDSYEPLSKKLQRLLDAQKKLSDQQRTAAARAQSESDKLRAALNTVQGELQQTKNELTACRRNLNPKMQLKGN